MILKQSIATLRSALFLIAAISLAGTAQADITYSPGGANADGTATGTITGVTYDSNGNLSSVEFTDTDGQTYDITNGEKDNDIDDFGSKLEKAFDDENEVTITADMGDMTGLTRKKKKKVEEEPKPAEQQPIR